MVPQRSPLTPSAGILDLAVFLPEKEITNQWIAERVVCPGVTISAEVLSRLMGTETRYFADADVQVSDLAVAAARILLDRHPEVDIDLLIFAAASSDLIEPATANIVQTKLGLSCPVMDVKNACSSFVSAMNVAAAFINADIYRHVLVVNGEKLSEVIQYRPRDQEHWQRCLSSYSLGDAGAAMLLAKQDSRRIVHQKFMSYGEFWSICTVKGGGSLAFRDPEMYYFEGQASKLRDVFGTRIPGFLRDVFTSAGWTFRDIDCLISHQVSNTTVRHLAQCLRIPKDRAINNFSRYGNTAAASIPISLNEAVTKGMLKPGSHVCIIGLAAGISLSVQLIEW